MTDHRPALRARLARGCYLPAARDHAQLLLRIAERHAAAAQPHPLPPMLTTTTTASPSRETVRTFGTMLLVAAVFLWLGYSLGTP